MHRPPLLLNAPFGAFRPLVFLALLVLLLPSAGPSAASEGANVKLAKAGTEAYERQVDEVALSAQQNAISKIKALIHKYVGTGQEAVLLSKLADIQQQKASVIFRISHGEAHHSGKALSLDRYHKAMSDSLSTLDQLIAKFPHFEEIPHAYFMRGKGYEEIEKKDLAARDYQFLISHFPDADETPSAYMSLAEFAIDANDHAKAIGFLKEIEKRPEDPHYPYALYKLAWSYYNLKNIPQALEFVERHIRFFSDKKNRMSDDGLATSDLALKENSLLDATLFYFEGYEEGLPQYTLDKALDYFKKLEEGPVNGKMALRFAKQLRAHEHDKDLITWKNMVLADDANYPEDLDVAITVYDYQLNKHRYKELVVCAQDFVNLYNRRKGKDKDKDKEQAVPNFAKAQKMLLDTADGMQASIVKNKDSTDVRSYSGILAKIYDAFIGIVDPSDPRIPRVHYNLAETLFTIKDYPGATENYRWVVDHAKSKEWKENPVLPSASLKAIASRYEVLRKKGLIPKTLAAESYGEDSKSDLDPMLSEWIQWIATHRDRAPTGSKDVDNFAFESSRALYAEHHLKQATQIMREFARKHPTSKYAIPSATLVLDTWIATGDWDKVQDQAEDFLGVKEWKGTDFSKKLFAAAADAFYKKIEKMNRDNNFDGVLGASKDFLKKYGASARASDTLTLAGNAAMATGDKSRAQGYFDRIIAENKQPTEVATALMARSQMEEDRYDFLKSATDSKAYLSILSTHPDSKLSKKQLNALRRKTLIMSWLSGDPVLLNLALQSKSICVEDLESDCEIYSALDGFRKHTPKIIESAFDQARKASDGQAKTLLAALALEGVKDLAFRDRLLMVRTVASGWDDLDSLQKFYLIPLVSASIPKAFQLNRMSMGQVAPLRADERYITRRVEVIREMENAATKVIKLPWSRMRAAVLNELASLYIDLARGLTSLPAPKGLTGNDLTAYNDTIQKLSLPFEEKGQDVRGKAFEIASQFAVEAEVFSAIQEPFFSENPSQAKALKPEPFNGPRIELGPELLKKLDPKGDWDKEEISDSQTPSGRLKAAWLVALKGKRWQQVGFFLQEAQEKALIQAGMMSAMKAVSLAAAGARGEGLAELEDGKGDLEPRARTIAVSVLIRYYIDSCSKDHTKSLISQMPDEKDLNKDQLALLASANQYANGKK